MDIKLPKRTIKDMDIKERTHWIEDGEICDYPFLPAIYDVQKEKIIYDFDTHSYLVYDKDFNKLS